MAEWLPIESAPKDGTLVLLWQPRGPVFGRWRKDEGFASKKKMWLDESFDDFSCGFTSRPISATHWHPLPDPPTIEEP